jgi:hypothetical protein
MEQELASLYGKVVLGSAAAAPPEVSLRLSLTTAEVRSILVGGRLLDVKASRLVSWAGSMNLEDTLLPRWQRPFVSDGQLVYLCLLLGQRELRVAARTAERFAVDTETVFIARTFHWLRRIRKRRLDDPRWERLEIPAVRTPWRSELRRDGGLRLTSRAHRWVTQHRLSLDRGSET